MLCRLQCARFAIRWHIADALPSSPRHSHGRRRLSRGGTPPVKVWLGGSTPNKITSCLRTSRSEFLLIHFCSRHGNEQLDGASLNTPFLFRRRPHAPLSLVAIRAVSSPCAALRRSARLSRDCSSSRRENAETFASLLVPAELSRSSLIFAPRRCKRTKPLPSARYYKAWGRGA